LGQQYYVQTIDDNGIVTGLVPCDLDGGIVIEPEQQHIETVVGSLAHYAFAFAKDNIVRGSIEHLRKVLASRSIEFAERPFLSIDIHEFVGDKNALAAACEQAAKVLSQQNSEMASLWLHNEFPNVEHQNIEQASNLTMLPNPLSPVQEPPRTRLGRYDLLEELGSGAEGRIFKARRVEPGVPGVAPGELVALKRLRQTGNDTQSDLFKRTARILQALDHPNIARYKDSFVWRDDELDEEVHCLVTELLEGQTLKQLMERNERGLPWIRARQILLPVLHALEYAGNHSVIHCDLKPSNIYLTSQGDIKLIDFGIARHQDSGAITSTAGLQGTWDYMACDFVRQAGNFRGDQQSDIFSFGVCFYQLLTGVLPYPTLGSNAQMAYFRRCMSPEKLPKVKYTHPVFNVLRGARACVQKCLAFDRAARYQTFTEVLAAFKLIQSRRLQDSDGEQYEYVDYIGKGGFGRVFRARRVSDGLEVAIKEVLTDLNNSRFVREAKMLKIMRHPHLVQYLDFIEVSEHGIGEERRLFLVLEYLQGMPQAGLNYRIKTSPSGLDPVEVLHIFNAYLDCLEYLHQKRLVHRDIKPGNLYAPLNAPERAKLFDLGIAHDTEGTKTHGQVPGTLDYMPYEFASQEGERGSAQSDIYSIGVTLYQALTAKLPLDRLPDDEKMAWIAWYERCEKPPEIPFNHPVFSTHPELEKLLRRALAFHPRDRFGSAGAMRHEIQVILENWDRARRKEPYEEPLEVREGEDARPTPTKESYVEALEVCEGEDGRPTSTLAPIKAVTKPLAGFSGFPLQPRFWLICLLTLLFILALTYLNISLIPTTALPTRLLFLTTSGMSLAFLLVFFFTLRSNHKPATNLEYNKPEDITTKFAITHQAAASASVLSADESAERWPSTSGDEFGETQDAPVTFLDQQTAPSGFFTRLKSKQPDLFGQRTASLKRVEQTFEFYRSHLDSEYRTLSQQAKNTHRLWIVCVLISFFTLIGSVCAMLLGYVDKGIFASVASALPCFMWKIFHQKEDYYRKLADVKLENLEYGNHWLLVIQSIDFIEDQELKMERHARLVQVLLKRFDDSRDRSLHPIKKRKRKKP
jgi:serine/threonine protein kinase